MNQTFTQTNTYTLKFGLPIMISLGVFALWFYGDIFIHLLSGILSPAEENYSPFFWQEFFLLFLSGTLVGLMIEKLSFKRTFIYLSIFWFLWFITCMVTARFSGDLLFVPVFLTTLTVFVAIKLSRLWQTDMTLHEKLGQLSLKTLSFEAKSAILRTDSCVQSFKNGPADLRDNNFPPGQPGPSDPGEQGARGKHGVGIGAERFVARRHQALRTGLKLQGYGGRAKGSFGRFHQDRSAAGPQRNRGRNFIRQERRAF